jgi:SAM-dependent methyltransferase
MALHPLAERFVAVADHYERGRPEYQPVVADALMAELGLDRGAAVLDLAAGTGKLTRALIAAGLDVTAVEPQAAFRERLAEQMGDERVRQGTAEAIPLADGAVAAVTVADAFHWFDQRAALEEVARVLRPGGGLAVVSTFADWSEASWIEEVGSLIAGLRPEHPHFDGPPWREAVAASGRWRDPREVRVTFHQRVDAQSIVDHIASISWMAALPDEERDRTMARARELVLAGDTPAQIPVHVTLGLTRLA